MRRFGLIGKSLKHSFSKDYFTKKFAAEHIADCSYENFELLSISDFPGLIKNHPGIEGLNITIPYKEEIISFLHHQSEIVKEIGACNCIKITDGKLTGYNTDAPAFARALKSGLKKHHQAALILGSGGASKAVQYALQTLDIPFKIVSRQQKINGFNYEELDSKLIEQYKVIINTTPLGMYPNLDARPPIPYDNIGKEHFLFDLTYNPSKTKFLLEGEKRGAMIRNGYEMLIYQAEESWKIWNSSGS